MGNKSKRRARQRRRDKFVSLQALENGENNINVLVEEARRRGRKGRERVRREDRAKAVAETALKTADELTELYLTNLPDKIVAPDLVKALLTELYSMDVVPMEYVLRVCHTSDPFPESPVLRCEIRLPKDPSRAAVAYVSVRSEAIAQFLLPCSPLSFQQRRVNIELCKRPVVPGVGSAWRSRRDPATASWRIGMIQFGEKVADDLFSTFWSSSEFFDLSENCHIEVSPVERILALIIGSPQEMWKATSIYGNFERTESIMRIEVPFRSLCRSPCVERNPDSKQDCAVYFPISRPPFLFRAEDSSFVTDPNLQRDLLWDCTQDTFESVRWVRTVDPTRHHAFARARGFRIMLGSNDMNALFVLLHRLCIVDTETPFPVPGMHRIEKSHPSRRLMFQRAAKWFNVPYSVRYMVDCVLSVGSISLTAVNSEFWRTLCEGVSERDALAALDLMFVRLTEFEHFSHAQNDLSSSFVTDPVAILKECMEMCNVQRNEKGEAKSEQQNLSKQSSSDESASSTKSDETDEFLLDEVFQRLTQEEINLAEESEETWHPKLTNEMSISTAKVRLPSRQHALIRRLLFTPTRVIVQPPETDLLNRVLREFSIYHDRFLRISFCDEDGGSIGYTGSDDLYTRVRTALRYGVHAAGDKFVFLAFSNSQLRDHAVWMYNETYNPKLDEKAPPNANEIRVWMGDFSKIRSPGKFAARQGQAFSSTVGTVLLDDVQQYVVKDIYDKNKQHMFSDGVGLMSSDVARKVAEKLRLTILEEMPSAYQVRFGGAKGMLTVWDEAFAKVGKRANGQVEVILRGSMKKFECNHKALEIVGYSKRLPLFLNRQIITLLSGLGVPDEVFEELQNKVLRQLDRAMQTDGATDALHLLYTSGAFDGGGGMKLRVSGPTMDAATFFRAGLTCVNCELLFNIMYAYRRRTIRELMLRARIPIDAEKGLCAIGIMDELGVLKPNETFCQYTLPSTGEVKVVRGRVTVGRSPCLHPGDIQPLMAVDKKELHSLVDVIVFPQCGERPIPSMLSGGDLDGDIYFCIFEETIPYPREHTFHPMTHTAPKPIALEREVGTEDVANFFVEYIQNDKLGVIANAHVVFTDKEPDGIMSRKCLKLADLHSVAVDFAKTGVAAKIPPELLPRNVRDQYPDFMGKHAKLSYTSKKILGKLYRACRMRTSDNLQEEDIQFVQNESADRVHAILESFANSITDEMKEEAESMCYAYNVEIIRLMQQFGVRTEGEVVSGHVVEFSERHAQLRGRREHFALQMKLNRQMHELRSQFREEFFRDFHTDDDQKVTVDVLLKACAWYMACHRQVKIDRENGNCYFVSFPWVVVSDVLLRIISNELVA